MLRGVRHAARAAIASGAVHAVLPLAEIARELKRLAKIPELTEA